MSSINKECFRNSANLQRVNIQRTDGDLITLGSKVFNGCNNLKYIVAPTLTLAVQYRTAWSASADKMSAEFCGYIFYATNEGGADAYAITSEDDLRYLASVINDNSAGITNNKTFRQTKPITLSNDVFTPIGLNDNHYFSGTYDGGDYTISGLNIGQIGDISLFGLFGYVKNGTVKNVRLFRPSAITTDEVDLSPFIARGYNATVKNSVVINPTMKGNGNTYYYSNYYIGRGAIIGRNNSCTLQNLYFYGDDYNAVGLTDGGGSSTNVGRAHKVTIGSSIASVIPRRL